MKVSVKSSDVFLSIGAYKELSDKTNYPLHLGITDIESFPGTINHLLIWFPLLDGIVIQLETLYQMIL